jgi:hypothetical protein
LGISRLTKSKEFSIRTPQKEHGFLKLFLHCWAFQRFFFYFAEKGEIDILMLVQSLASRAITPMADL